MAIVSVKPNEALYSRALAVLDGRQLRQALFQGVKRTTREGRTDVRREIGDKANVAKKYIDRVIRAQLVTRDPEPPIGMITVDDEALPLIAFKPRITKKSGVTAKLSNDGNSVKFLHAFAATMKSGHLGIFMRLKMPIFGPQTTPQDLVKAGFPEHEARAIVGRGGQEGRGIRHMTRLASGGNFPRATPRGFAWRLPIRELVGVSVERFAEIKGVADKVVGRLQERMDKNFASQIDRFTK